MIKIRTRDKKNNFSKNSLNKVNSRWAIEIQSVR